MIYNYSLYPFFIWCFLQDGYGINNKYENRSSATPFHKEQIVCPRVNLMEGEQINHPARPSSCSTSPPELRLRSSHFQCYGPAIDTTQLSCRIWLGVLHKIAIRIHHGLRYRSQETRKSIKMASHVSPTIAPTDPRKGDVPRSGPITPFFLPIISGQSRR